MYIRKRQHVVTRTAFCCCCFLVCVLPVLTDDPVYTPQTLSDAAGNTADNASLITWADWPAGDAYVLTEPSRVSEGLSAYYNMIHGFIDAIFVKGFPNDLLEKLADQDLSAIVGSYSNYIPYFLGFAIAVVTGLLFIIIFPIFAVCFCCCRCCGNCGGRKKQDPKQAGSNCRKGCFIITLIISTSFLLVSAICIYVNNSNTSTTLTSLDDVVNDTFSDARTFTNNTLQEVERIAGTNLNFTIDALFRDLDNMDYLLGIPVRDQIKNNTNLTSTIAIGYNISTKMDDADTALTNVETAMTDLETSINSLNTSLTSFKTNMDTIFSSCGVNCPSSGQPSYSSASVDVDTSQFPSLTGARTSMDNAKNTNMTQQLETAEAELDNLPETVKNESNTTISDMKTDIDALRGDLAEVLSTVEDLNDEISGANSSLDLDKLSSDLRDYTDILKQYDQYRWYGGVGLASVVLVVVVFALLGLLFGLCGTHTVTPPHQRGCLSNCGGIFLMASAAFILIFSTLLMLLTFPTFMVGAPFHQLVCYPLTDLDKLEEVEDLYNKFTVGKDKYSLGNLLFQNDSIPLTLYRLLKDCKGGESAFNAFQLGSKFDIDDMLNYSKTIDINATIANLTINLTSVQVYPADLQQQLLNLNDAVNISFTDFYNELSNSPTTVDLGDLADDIDTYVTSNPSMPPGTKTSLNAQATELRRIESEEYAYVSGNTTALNTSVGNMETTVADIPTLVDALGEGLQNADDYMQNNASDLIKTELETYAGRVVGIIDSFVGYTGDAVKNKMGKCTPVWNIYNTLVVHTFCYNFLDTFNGFWFSLGWAVFFFMFSLIFSVKTAKYFRTMTEIPDELMDDVDDNYSLDYLPDSKGRPDVSSHHMPPNSKFPKRNNKVHHYDSEW
ncbi:prominin-1-like [Mya arenaria]|uniref:prominin-1-like n=1 Tax=Mya arenaria TaxID=6604 RepID=UPI0022E6CF24|nr:prominin-1-like [Mya arenaria]XP_052773575.1 prominin-1-like [Mya arenaria]XP_052773576.1 prominin-1-like [Mya arenaria]XP_052773577.1 prominin-1-like [Mya arenaria]XP_052773578.1 prominin-1-like [Mya arenaria]XP_052773579.1 prominin-1-like [Mya arenaria]XP_052773580.1 prominin-1-like [Mya arenaria]